MTIEPDSHDRMAEQRRDDPTWPPQQPQRQDSLRAQLIYLHRVAGRLGMYDAADWLWKQMPT